jgi:TM2 domain-containing membrane protein YozV
MAKICENCNESIADENAIVCSNCGKPVSQEASYHFDSDSSESANASNASEKTSASYSSISPTQTKSPFLALILSFFFTGLGQVYNGNFRKGLYFIFGVWIGIFFFFFPGLIIMIWGLWDAYTDAEKVNRGELPFKEPTVWEIIGIICVPYILIFVLIFVFFIIYILFFAAIMAFIGGLALL